MKHLLWCLAHSYCSESVSNHYHDYVGSQIWESNTAKTKIALKKKKKNSPDYQTFQSGYSFFLISSSLLTNIKNQNTFLSSVSSLLMCWDRSILLWLWHTQQHSRPYLLGASSISPKTPLGQAKCLQTQPMAPGENSTPAENQTSRGLVVAEFKQKIIQQRRKVFIKKSFFLGAISISIESTSAAPKKKENYISFINHILTSRELNSALSLKTSVFLFL